MKYFFKVDGQRATIDRDHECVVMLDGEKIAPEERFVAYGAACLFVAYNLVGLAGDVHEPGDMGDAFYERAYLDLESRWLDYVQDCHDEWSGENVPEAERVQPMTREECEEAVDAMRMRMSDFQCRD